MSHNKSIESGKEHRKHYRKSKVFDHTCRNHGSCSYCKENRLYNTKKKLMSSDEQLKNINSE